MKLKKGNIKIILDTSSVILSLKLRKVIPYPFFITKTTEKELLKYGVDLSKIKKVKVIDSGIPFKTADEEINYLLSKSSFLVFTEDYLLRKKIGALSIRNLRT